MKESLTFDTIPTKFCAMVEEYRLELAKKSWIDLQLDVSLPWKTICWIHETVLISNKFGFIKWLVYDKDAVDIGKLIFADFMPYYKNRYEGYQIYDDIHGLLMILQIQPDPIDFLIKCLR